jgi:exosortase B
MSTKAISNSAQTPSWKAAWPILIGLFVLYFPIYKTLANTLRQHEEYAHGPIILAIVLWLMWLGRAQLVDSGQEKNSVSGAILLIIGLLLYLVGYSQDISIFDVGSQIPLLLGIMLLIYGAGVTKNFWFPLLFLVFLIPLPDVVIDTLTGPLKQLVSVLAENILYQLGYPIARSGVMLSIGQYQLLVADACSGLNSMFSLSALGLFYAYLVKRMGWVHNTILLASVIPIAFFANVMRVILLVLITYYFGDEVGQGFAHKMAGLVLFMAALISFLILDGMIHNVMKWKQERSK